MIDRRDVIRLKVPFPTISAQLAVKAHMYICTSRRESEKRLVKCQTYKLSTVIGSGDTVDRFVQENPCPERNPFKQATLTDCDKLFCTDTTIPLSLRAGCSVCEELIRDIDMELCAICNVPVRMIRLSGDELAQINPLIRTATDRKSVV